MKEVTPFEMLKFMLEETGVPFDYVDGHITVPNVVSINIVPFEDDHDCMMAVAIEIIAQYISALHEKHESECRMISAYDLALKRKRVKVRKRY